MNWRWCALSLVSLAVLTADAGAAARQAQAPTFRTGARAVPLYVTVRDRGGRLIPNLARGDFEVRDNGRAVPITLFSSSPQPFTMVLLVDMSTSMAPHYRQARDAMLTLVEELRPDDRVRLGTFGDDILFTPFLTSDKETLRRLLHYELWPGGPSPFWDAMSRSIWSLDDEPGRRVVLTVTDGRDTCRGRACVEFEDVEPQAMRSGTMIYAIAMPGSSLDGKVKRLAERTGGGHFELPDGADMTSTFRRVADELHHQYLLGFTPAADGKRHSIDVRLKPRGLTARTRRDYIAQ